MAKRITFALRCRYLLEYVVFRVAVCLLQVLSPRAAARLARRAAWVMCRVVPKKWTRYHVAEANLRLAFGDELTDEQRDRLILEMWVHLFRMIVEIAQLPRKLRLNNFRDVFEFRDRARVVRAVCSGRPMILVSGHYGNWEMSLAVFGLLGLRMHAVARPLDNPYLNRWFEAYRQHTGHRLVPKRGAVRRLACVLEQGQTAALLGDQDAGLSGIFVDFFGHPASTFPTVARLALDADALICVGYSRRLTDDFNANRWVRYELGCLEVIDPRHYTGPNAVRQITQQVSWALERAVRLSPEQYFWVHRRWKTKPPFAKTEDPARRAA